MIGIATMKIVNMYSMGEIKYLMIKCPECGMRFAHSEGAEDVKCPRVHCTNFDTLTRIRDRFTVGGLEPNCKTVTDSSNFSKKWSKIQWTSAP